MRILLWAPLGAGTHYWGPGTSAFRLYNRGLPCRYSVSLAHGCTEQEDFKQVYSQQFKIYTINRNNPFTQLCFIYKGNYWLKKNHANFDVFHGIGAFQTTFGPAIRWAKFGKPSFLKVTGSSGGVEDSSFYSKMLGFSRQRERQANMIKGYIAISTDIREKLINFGVHPEKVHLIPNGVDTRIFRPAELEEKLRLRRNLNIPNISTFIFVGG